MKIAPRPKRPILGETAPDQLTRRLRNRLEAGIPPKLEGRFKDGRERAGGPRLDGTREDVSGSGGGDLRRSPRPEPRATRNRT